MEIKLNIAKTHFWILLAVIVLLGAGIFVYAVGAGTQGHPTQDVLQDCRIDSSLENTGPTTLYCPSGYKLISGGCEITGGEGTLEDMISSYPLDGDGWFCQASIATRTIIAYTYCCK